MFNDLSRTNILAENHNGMTAEKNMAKERGFGVCESSRKDSSPNLLPK
jgi:hypothetical protein